MKLLESIPDHEISYQIDRTHPMGRSECWQSPDNRHRFALRCIFPTAPIEDDTRFWRVMVFLMLNPSLADAFTYDPTATRCMRRAVKAGADACVLLNLFSYRTPSPADLVNAGPEVENPINDAIIKAMGRGQSPLLPNGMATDFKIICGWGSHGTYRNKGARTARFLRSVNAPMYALRVTKDGQPGHPLYLPYSLTPGEWTADQLMGQLSQ